MNLPVWVVPALAFQLLFVFFTPPITLGDHRLFLSDLWCVLWLTLGISSFVSERKKPQIKRLLGTLAMCLILIAVIYAHGSCRTRMVHTKEWHDFFFLLNHETDLFQAGRELIIALRFLSWVYSAILVHFWFSRAPSANARAALNILYEVLAYCIAINGFLMVIEALFPEAQLTLGRLFLFDPTYLYWAGRAYGTFGSPVEAACVLVLGVALLISARGWKAKRLVQFSIICALAGFYCSKTLTPAIAFAIGILGLMGLRFRSKLFTKKWGTASLLAAAALIFVLFQKYVFLQGKMTDVVTRLSLWVFYLKRLASRPDYMALGFGFTPLHTDNSYLFILTRGGIAAAAGLVFGFWQSVYKKWRIFNWKEQGWIIYLLITGMTFDVFIYRHVVTVLIAVGIPSLALARHSKQD